MKTCGKCLKVLSLSEFHRDSSAADNRQGTCRICRSVRDRKWREANRDKVLERKREYGDTYYKSHRDKILEQKREYREIVSMQIRRMRRNENSTSLGLAVHHYQQWSYAEDLIALRADLTAKEAAFMLGRSINSVAARRTRLRQKANLANGNQAGAA